MSKVVFESDGYTLAGNLYLPRTQQKNMAFLFIQGWAGYQNLYAAEAVAKLGMTTMTYDMRGNGESEGELANFSRADFINDAIAAYDYLRGEVGPSVPIAVIGSSFGAYTAVLLSAERKVHSLSLKVPANYPDIGYDKPRSIQTSLDTKEWRKQKMSYTKNKALRALHEFTGKIQIIEADSDEVVTRQTPQNYAEAVADKRLLTYEVMQDAPHSVVNDRLRADYTQRLLTWIKFRLM